MYNAKSTTKQIVPLRTLLFNATFIRVAPSTGNAGLILLNFNTSTYDIALSNMNV